MKPAIKKEEVVKTICPECKKEATVRSIVVRETKPYKRISYTECKGCGLNETAEEDIEALDYGVSITCDFTDKSTLPDNIRRMAFVNHNSEVTFYHNNKKAFSFSTINSNVDCIEGVILRAVEIVEANIVGNPALKDTLSTLNSLKKDGFKMTIADNTGYSKVCPVGMEYTQAQDMSFDDLNSKDKTVAHKKTPKASSK
ncbi:uncharacterized protein VICG_00841 [Vittaforma corneae ATCC 50505]|uniref:Uncharacterized protein n=1 Tax=Vittaforma corneae (strain ATCC 50505) TaxID=993615 RepID=L2GMS5_VITCO|nr:uncharacterized protein VICG_00841 [Vittaforma corneae ATCC 50505]ELA42198.1 hypothetical protein VICG_00841 [Vittaforma corneae ATCC 50505]